MIEFIYPFIGEGRENSLMRMNWTYESIDDVSGEKELEQIKDKIKLYNILWNPIPKWHYMLMKNYSTLRKLNFATFFVYN